jgi:tRNA pseudouridine55 synthase
MNQTDLHGILAINKPPGVTSRRVVDAVSRALSTKAVGHAGTLDPLARGVVIVCTGHARKLVDFLHQQKKAYTVSFLLGRSSPSDDFETEVSIEAEPYCPSLQQIEESLKTQRGTIMQLPCTYSAKKIAGKRAYKLARLGKQVVLQPKEIHIHQLEITAYDWPRLELSLVCSSGTFVRALGRDIAKYLGTCAVMETLVRTAVGPYLLDTAVSLADITPDTRGKRFIEAALRPPISALPHLEARTLTPEQIEHAARGGHLSGRANAATDTVAAVDAYGVLLGILRVLPQGGWRLRPNFIDTSPHTG